MSRNKRKVSLLLIITILLQLILIGSNETEVKASVSVAIDHKSYVFAGYGGTFVITEDNELYGMGSVAETDGYLTYRPKKVASDITNLGYNKGDRYMYFATTSVFGSVITNQSSSFYLGSTRYINTRANKILMASDVTCALPNRGGALTICAYFGQAALTGTYNYVNATFNTEDTLYNVNDFTLDPEGEFIYVLKTDGKVYRRGDFYLSTYVKETYTEWTEVEGLTNIVGLATNTGGYTYAVDSSGKIYGFHHGTVSTLTATVPNTVEIAASGNSIIALTNTGDVYSVVFDPAWNTVTTPSLILSSVIDIDASKGVFIAARSDGTIWTWGTGDNGTSTVSRLGLDGSNRTSPTMVKNINLFPKTYISFTNAVLGPDGKIHKFNDYTSVSVITNNGSTTERTYGISSNLSYRTAMPIFAVTSLENGLVGVIYATYNVNTASDTDSDGNPYTYDYYTNKLYQTIYYIWNSSTQTYIYYTNGNTLTDNSSNNYIPRRYGIHEGFSNIVGVYAKTTEPYGYQYEYGALIGSGAITFTNNTKDTKTSLYFDDPIPDKTFYSSGFENLSGIKYLQTYGSRLKYDYTRTSNGINGYYRASDSTLYMPYNYPPSLSIYTPSSTFAINGTGTFSLYGYVSDSEGGNITVYATFAGVTKSQVLSGSGYWNLTWSVAGDILPEGLYSNITVYAVDAYNAYTSGVYYGNIYIDKYGPNVPNINIGY